MLGVSRLKQVNLAGVISYCARPATMFSLPLSDAESADEILSAKDYGKNQNERWAFARKAAVVGVPVCVLLLFASALVVQWKQFPLKRLKENSSMRAFLGIDNGPDTWDWCDLGKGKNHVTFWPCNSHDWGQCSQNSAAHGQAFTMNPGEMKKIHFSAPVEYIYWKCDGQGSVQRTRLYPSWKAWGIDYAKQNKCNPWPVCRDSGRMHFNSGPDDWVRHQGISQVVGTAQDSAEIVAVVGAASR